MNLEPIVCVVGPSFGLSTIVFEKPCHLISCDFHPPSAGSLTYKVFDSNDVSNTAPNLQVSQGVVPSTSQSIFKNWHMPLPMKRGCVITLSGSDSAALAIVTFLPVYPRSNIDRHVLTALEALNKIVKLLTPGEPQEK